MTLRCELCGGVFESTSNRAPRFCGQTCRSRAKSRRRTLKSRIEKGIDSPDYIDPRRQRGFARYQQKLAVFGLEMTVSLADYSNAATPQTLRCTECGRSWPNRRPDKVGPAGFLCPCMRALSRVSLSQSHPSLAKEWDQLFNRPARLEEITKGSDKVFRWNGQCGHSWMSSVSNRVKGQGCPFCSGKAVLPGFNDLRSRFPEVAAEIDLETEPEDLAISVTAFSHRRVNWSCAEGHTWKAIVKNRSNGRGCPYCTNRLVWFGWNDLQTRAPDLAIALSSTDPRTLYFRSTSSQMWRCEFGHPDYRSSPKQRVDMNTGCPACSGRVAVPGETDLASQNPQAAALFWEERNGVKSTEVTLAGGGIFWWHCRKGHEYEAPLVSMGRSDSCWGCAGKILVPGENDLATTDPIIAQSFDYERNEGILPSDLTRGSGRLCWWVCSEGHRWETSPNTRCRSGCRQCADHGFNPGKPASLYFIENAVLATGKVGITNRGTDRLQYWTSHGWNLVHLVEDESGQAIWDLEQTFFAVLRHEWAIPIALSAAEIGSRGGWSETFPLENPGTNAVLELISDLQAKVIEASS